MWEGTEPPRVTQFRSPLTFMSFSYFSLFSQLLPKRHDWLGNEHRKSLDEVVSAMKILTSDPSSTPGDVGEWWETLQEDGILHICEIKTLCCIDHCLAGRFRRRKTFLSVAYLGAGGGCRRAKYSFFSSPFPQPRSAAEA